jgi:hypothetical protein
MDSYNTGLAPLLLEPALVSLQIAEPIASGLRYPFLANGFWTGWLWLCIPASGDEVVNDDGAAPPFFFLFHSAFGFFFSLVLRI